jgi:hypothetical protein
MIDIQETLTSDSSAFAQVSRLKHGMMRDHLVTIAFIDSIRQNMIAEPTFNRGQVERHMMGTSEHFIGNIDKLYQECRRRGVIFGG